MSLLRRAFLVLSLGLVPGFAWAKAEPPTKAARAAFDAYINALSTKNGAAAAKVVTSGTLEYYEKMRIAALQAPAKVVKEMGLAEQIIVLVLRIEIKVEDLRRMNGEKVFIEAVRRGWVDSSMLAHADIGRLDVRGDVGTGKLMKDGRDLGFEWYLERQGGVWKNDLLRLVQVVDMVLKQQLKAAGIDQLQLVQNGVEALAGRKIPQTIRDPPPTSGAASK